MLRLRYSSVILAAGILVLFFGGGSRFAMGLMLKPMADDLEWGRSTISLAVTAFMLVSALAMPVVGRLVDQYSLRVVMAASVAASAIGIALMGSIAVLWQAFVLYGGVYALGHAGTSIAPVGVMISRWFPRRTGMANSVAIAGNGLGQLVIITALAAALSDLGWRRSFAALGFANMLFVLPVVLAAVRSRPLGPAGEGGAGDSPSLRPAPPETGRTALPASRQLWLLVVVYAACGFQDFFVATHVVAFAQDKGMEPVQAGRILALMGLVGIVGVLGSGALADSFGAARVTAACFLMRIAIFAYILAFQDTASIVAFALLYGLTFWVTAPLTLIFAANIFGTARLGAVSGTLSMVHQIAGGLGAFVGAVVFDTWGAYDGAFALMLALAVVGAATTVMVSERRSHSTALEQ